MDWKCARTRASNQGRVQEKSSKELGIRFAKILKATREKNASNETRIMPKKFTKQLPKIYANDHAKNRANVAKCIKKRSKIWQKSIQKGGQELGERESKNTAMHQERTYAKRWKGSRQKGKYNAVRDKE